jgi:hypothetical protein
MDSAGSITAVPQIGGNRLRASCRNGRVGTGQISIEGQTSGSECLADLVIDDATSSTRDAGQVREPCAPVYALADDGYHSAK